MRGTGKKGKVKLELKVRTAVDKRGCEIWEKIVQTKLNSEDHEDVSLYLQLKKEVEKMSNGTSLVQLLAFMRQQVQVEKDTSVSVDCLL